MADGRIFKIVQSPYFSSGLTDRHHVELPILSNETANIIF